MHIPVRFVTCLMTSKAHGGLLGSGRSDDSSRRPGFRAQNNFPRAGSIERSGKSRA